MNRITSLARSFWTDEDGATMIEYGLLAALIALVCAIAVSTIGTNLAGKFNKIKDCTATPSNCPATP